MKNLFFSMAFTLVGSFAFAANSNSTILENFAVENEYTCMYITNGCGQLSLVCWPGNRGPKTSDFEDLDWSCPQ